MTGTWYSRDLLVLSAIAPRLDQNPGDEILVSDIEVETLNQDDIDRAFDALVEGEYVNAQPMHDASSRHWLIDGLTEKGRRASGLWPDAEAFAERILALLDQQIESTDDPDTRSRLQRIRDNFRDLPRQAFIGFATSLGSGAILGM